MMCAMAFTICYHLPGDAQHALDPCSVPNEMDNLCPALVCVAVAGCSVPLFVCFNYKSLFIAATATRVWRRHDARIIVFDAIFSSAFTIFFLLLALSRVCVFVFFVGTICWCMAFLHYRSPSSLSPSTSFTLLFSLSSECNRAQIRVHFIRLLDALSPVADTFSPASLRRLCHFFSSRIFLLFGICLA